MDNPTFPAPESRSTGVARFVPDRRFTAAGAAGAVIATVVAAVTDDRVGRLMVGIAAVVLAAYVVGDLVFSPRLEASPDGLVIRSPFTRARLEWAEIESVKVVSRLRFGLRNSALEVDAGATLAEFSRRSLGVDPDEACLRVLTIRPD